MTGIEILPGADGAPEINLKQMKGPAPAIDAVRGQLAELVAKGEAERVPGFTIVPRDVAEREGLTGDTLPKGIMSSVSVSLSDPAFHAGFDAIFGKKPKKKGGNGTGNAEEERP